jgi:hypothetical protein
MQVNEYICTPRLQRLLDNATKGRWQRSGVRVKGAGHLIGPDGDGVCNVPYDPRHHAECLANADLIAQARALAEEVLRLRGEAPWQ